MTTVEEVREAARRLPPVEQFQLIQELLRGLERGYQLPGDAIPAGVRRAAPVTDLAELVSAAGLPISPFSEMCANPYDWAYRLSTGVLRLGIAYRDGRGAKEWVELGFRPTFSQHARDLEPFTGSRIPDPNRQGSVGNVQRCEHFYTNKCTANVVVPQPDGRKWLKQEKGFYPRAQAPGFYALIYKKCWLGKDEAAQCQAAEAAATLELTPAWLRFLQAQELITAEQRATALRDLHRLVVDSAPIWEQRGADPTVGATIKAAWERDEVPDAA